MVSPRARLLWALPILILPLVPLPGPAALADAAPPASGTPTVLAEAVSFDGSRWVVEYGAQLPPTPHTLELARALAAAGRFAYDNEARGNANPASPCFGRANPAANWGFDSLDADCVHHIRLSRPGSALPFLSPPDPLATMDCGQGTRDVTIEVAVNLREGLHAQGLYLNPVRHDLDAIARVVVGHEFFHFLQCWVHPFQPVWKVWVEGQARFVQTILDAAAEDDPTSFWYTTPLFAGDGVNDFQWWPYDSMCDYTRSYAHYWGFLYWKDGGIATLRRVLEELNGIPNQVCDRDLPVAITRALAARAAEAPGVAHATHAESLLDFALHVYTRDFRWGEANAGPQGPVHDWGAFMLEVTRPPQAAGPQAGVDPDVGAWGLAYTRLAPAGRYAVLFEPPDPAAWAARLLLRAPDGSVEVVPVEAGRPAEVRGDDHAEVVLNVVRLAPNPGRYDLDVTPLLP